MKTGFWSSQLSVRMVPAVVFAGVIWGLVYAGWPGIAVGVLGTVAAYFWAKMEDIIDARVDLLKKADEIDDEDL